MIQFDSPLSSPERSSIGDAGIRLLKPLGANAYFAVIESSKPSFAQSPVLNRLADVIEIKSEWKRHPLLANEKKPGWIKVNLPKGDVAPGAERRRLVLNVMFHSDVSLEPDAINEVAAVGGKVISTVESINALVVDIPESRLNRLIDRDAVQWVEPPLPPLDAVNDQNRVSTQAEVAQAPPYDLDGSGVSVMVFDSGTADASHADFGGRLTPRDLAIAVDHSTHVAGTIGGDGSSSGGLYRGMAPGVIIESFGFEPNLNEIGLFANPGDIERDYRDGLSFGVAVVNNSLGTNTCANLFPCEITGDYGVTSNLLDTIVTGGLGRRLTTVFASGNERNDIGECATGHCCRCIDEGVHTPEGYRSIAPPAGAKNTIAVGAVNSDDDSATFFSSWGPTDDGRLKPDISAPGCQNDGDGGVTSTVVGGGYNTFCGTSMATPTATGVIALILQDFRAQFPTKEDPLPSTVKSLLVHNAVEVGPAGPDYQTGYGSIRAVDTIEFLRTESFAELLVESADTSGFVVEVSGESTLKVTLAWDDAPATPNVVSALVNDLDLVVIDPNGVRHYPWTLNPNVPDALAVRNAVDTINNIEQVAVDSPVPGIWTVRVVGTNVPIGPQVFSIASGPQLQPDCDLSAVPDAIQIANDPSIDCTGNGVLDVCEPDCNVNGVADSCDILAGDADDCNGNVVPDSCELASGAADDCNGNGQLDACDVIDGAPDCNANMIPDSCETDCNSNGQPDDCDIAAGSSFDCNGSLIPDECDIAAGSSNDTNVNGTPDECEGPIIYVDADAVGANLGTDWANAYIDLQSALTVAQNSGLVEEIWIAEGVYRPTAGDDRSAHFRLIDDVGVYGGFAGTETNRLQRQWRTHETILSGDIGILDDPIDNSFHIVIASDVNSNAVLDGVTITSGRATGSAQDEADVGAAIFNERGRPSINNVIFKDNFSNGEFPDGGGGAVYNIQGGDGTFSNCDFLNNESRFGGGIYVGESNPTFHRCRFENGVAVAGGGIHNTRGSQPLIDECIFRENRSVQAGAITNELFSDATIQNSVFESNHADASNLAGAILNVDSNPLVIDCVFRLNTAGALGGAVHNLRGTNTRFVHCWFEGNHVTLGSSRGGAVSNQNSIIFVENCLFMDNEVLLDGGALYAVTSEISVQSSTFVGNRAQTGGAINILRGVVHVENSILVENQAINGSQVAVIDNSSADFAHCNLEGGPDGIFQFASTLTFGAGMLDADPMFVETFAFSHLLSQSAAGQLQDSPCVNAGSIGAMDLGLNLRTTRTDGLGDDGVVDMGYHHPLPDCNTNGVPDFEDIASGTSVDCGNDGNGIPDECESDCDTNGIVDSCEIQTGAQRDCDLDLLPDNCVPFIDCDLNGVFDACDIVDGVHEDCDANAVPDVCQPDCDGDQMPDACELIPLGLSHDCNSNAIPDECDIDSELSLDCDANGQPDECQPDCNSNAIADRCDIQSGLDEDCNSNGIPDQCDIANGESFDADGDGEPDECGIDCNQNGIADLFDVASGSSSDCDLNGVPDECQPDCNQNDVADICDLSGFFSLDCDANGVPDECDIASGGFDDCNSNGTPDVCELSGGAFSRVFSNPSVETQFSFPSALAMSDEQYLIGSAGDVALADGAGRAFLYEAETGELEHVFESPTPTEGEAFGASVFFTSEHIWIGAPGAAGNFENEGAVYVFDAATYGFEFAIANPSPAENDQFGGAAISIGDAVIVGARLDDTASNNSGAVYVFNTSSGSFERAIPNPTGQSTDLFGSTLAEAAGYLIVGVPRDDSQIVNSGIVQVIDVDTGSVVQTIQNPSPHSSDGFGSAVAGMGGNIVIGAPLDDTDGDNVGIAYLADAATGSILQTLHNPNPVEADQFGHDAATVGARAIVGVLLADVGAENAGSLIVFDALSGLPVGRMDNPSPQANDNFTSSMLGYRDRLLIGAWRDDSTGEDAGVVYEIDLGFDENANGSLDACDVCGDMDGDEDVDDIDLAAFLESFAQTVGDSAYLDLADFDRDGAITLIDYQLWFGCYQAFVDGGAQSRLGDFDGDGDVDQLDYAAWLDCYDGPAEFPKPSEPRTVESCIAAFDADNDGDLDMSDFAEIQTAETAN
ncbi:MAG: hypothetical protein DHS20C16_15810 [Phycisphaerae bacterium]|nr:MAG: hypothetical protein DHS20C16_15810 [Phycisphaerae bacterium]